MTNAFANDLGHRADQLADDIRRRAGTSTWCIGGLWGTGKTSLLQALESRLRERGLLPVVVSPPTRDMDTGPAALVQIGESLQVHGVVDGQLSTLQDLARPWPEKVDGTLSWIDRDPSRVVLLCDEVGSWPKPVTADDTFSPCSNQHIHDVIEAIRDRAHCRRVYTFPAPAKTKIDRAHDLPRDSHPAWLLCDGSDWNDLAETAHELHARLGAKLAAATPLEVRLLVALAAVTSVAETAAYYLPLWPDCQAIAARLAAGVGARDEFAALRLVWARLTFCRGSIAQAALDRLGAAALSPPERAVLYHGLLHSRAGGFELNHVLRFEPRVHSWLDASGRFETHHLMAEHYEEEREKARRSGSLGLGQDFEGYHHAALATDDGLIERFTPAFVDQLLKRGKALSKDRRDFKAAAQVFRQAVALYDLIDYGHHYWAYNVDALAEDQDLAEREYRRAIELNPEHPWWWSRWINFLITIGRAREARKAWAEAVNALGLTGGEGPATVYQSLHLWVARLAVHRVQLDFAEAVLAEIPAFVWNTDNRFAAVERLVKALREEERACVVFPLSVPIEKWWLGPHLVFPRELDGNERGLWFPARVEEVDDEKVHLVMGKRLDGLDSPEYAFVEIPRVEFDRASLDERAEALRSGRFLEAAFYGAEEIMSIRVHADVPWEPDDLPKLDLDPRRYLRKAGLVS